MKKQTWAVRAAAVLLVVAAAFLISITASCQQSYPCNKYHYDSEAMLCHRLTQMHDLKATNASVQEWDQLAGEWWSFTLMIAREGCDTTDMIVRARYLVDNTGVKRPHIWPYIYDKRIH